MQKTRELTPDGSTEIVRDESMTWYRPTPLGLKLAAQRQIIFEEWERHPEWREPPMPVPW